MSWTYDASLLATTPLHQVRYLVGDTIQADPQAQDEEINFAISQRSSVYGAAATVCRSLAANFSRLVDTVDKDLRTSYSTKARNYLRMASEFENQAKSRSGFAGYAGGISIADKIQQESDPDRVQPNFSVGMTDNDFLPVPPVGQETTTEQAAAAADNTTGEV